MEQPLSFNGAVITPTIGLKGQVYNFFIFDMKQLFLFLLVLCNSVGLTQTLRYPDIVIYQNLKTVNEFIPPGWAILNSASGDLNKDGLEDVAVVLQYQDTLKFVDYETGKVVTGRPRLLFILFRNADGSYRGAEQALPSYVLMNNNPEMQDPFRSIGIKKGILEIGFQLLHRTGNWDEINSIYKFRWQGNFALIGADLHIFKKADSQHFDYSYNFSTMQRDLTKSTVNGIPVTTTEAIFPDYGLKNLGTIRPPFTWEIENGIFL